MNNFWSSFFKLSIALATLSSFSAYGKEGLLADCGDIKVFGSNDNNVLKITQFQVIRRGITLSASNLKSEPGFLGSFTDSNDGFGIEIKVSQNGHDYARYADGYSAWGALLKKGNVKEAELRDSLSNSRIENLLFYRTRFGDGYAIELDGYIPYVTRIMPSSSNCKFGDAIKNQIDAGLASTIKDLEKGGDRYYLGTLKQLYPDDFKNATDILDATSKAQPAAPLATSVSKSDRQIAR